MAKSDTEFDHIDFSSARNPLRQPEWLDDTEIIAFDTETHKGDIFMISIASDSKTMVLEKGGEPLEPDFIFDKLTQKYFRSKLNIWYNISFDAEVILKVLPDDKLNELRVKNDVEWNGWEISYLRGKFLRIADGNNHKWEFFDVAQIFGTSLKKAVEDWLPESDIGKNEQDIDTTRFNEKQYIQENYDKIKEYAKDDATLTKKIAEKQFDVAENQFDIPCRKPYSTGYLAASYIRQRLNRKPGWAINSMQKMAWESYAGGRFEVFNRGDVGKVVGPDINSAYPAIMSKLPDPDTVEWIELDDPDIDSIREYEWGFVRATVTTNPDKKIQPFALKKNGKRVYPILEDYTVTVLKDIFEFAYENEYLQEYTIEKAIVGETREETKYPFDFFKDLYHERKILEENGNYVGGRTLKIILNSIYGKMLQTNWKVVDYGDIDPEALPDHQKFKPGPDMVHPHVVELKAGSLFNPFIATYITGRTRLKLHEAVERHDLVDDTYMFATDCVMIDKDAYEQSGFDSDLIADDSLPYREQLGKWDFDYEGTAFIVGSGVYQVETDEGFKKGVRGFEALHDKDIVEQARDADRVIEVKHNRPISMGEALHQGIDTADIGRFVDGKKDLSADFDTGRNWERENPSFGDLLDSMEGSTPLVVKE